MGDRRPPRARCPDRRPLCRRGPDAERWGAHGRLQRAQGRPRPSWPRHRSPARGLARSSDDLPWADGLHLTSDARTLVDNLAVSRGRAGRIARTLADADLEDWIVRTVSAAAGRLAPALRGRALEVCDELAVPDRKPQVVDIIGVAAGTREARAGAGPLLAARASGHEYDPERVTRFDELARFLASDPAEPRRPERRLPRPRRRSRDLPAVLRGVLLELHRGHRVLRRRGGGHRRDRDGPGGPSRRRTRHPRDLRGGRRPAPSGRRPHDRGRAVRAARAASPARDGRPAREASRPVQGEAEPGRAPTSSSRPNLVEGTLIEGFRRLADLPPGFSRAAFELFLISEVHPYDDGNGRVARAAMCAELTRGRPVPHRHADRVPQRVPDGTAKPVPRRPLRPVRADARPRLALDRWHALGRTAAPSTATSPRPTHWSTPPTPSAPACACELP